MPPSASRVRKRRCVLIRHLSNPGLLSDSITSSGLAHYSNAGYGADEISYAKALAEWWTNKNARSGRTASNGNSSVQQNLQKTAWKRRELVLVEKIGSNVFVDLFVEVLAFDCQQPVNALSDNSFGTLFVTDYSSNELLQSFTNEDSPALLSRVQPALEVKGGANLSECFNSREGSFVFVFCRNVRGKLGNDGFLQAWEVLIEGTERKIEHLQSFG